MQVKLGTYAAVSRMPTQSASAVHIHGFRLISLSMRPDLWWRMLKTCQSWLNASARNVTVTVACSSCLSPKRARTRAPKVAMVRVAPRWPLRYILIAFAHSEGKSRKDVRNEVQKHYLQWKER